MGIKTHQSKDGLWRRCSAKGNCPLGGEESHTTFDNVQDLAAANQSIIDSQGEEDYGFLPKASDDLPAGEYRTLKEAKEAFFDSEKKDDEIFEDAKSSIDALHAKTLADDARSQRPLKERVLEALEKKWTRKSGVVDEDMVKHCIKSYKYIDVSGSIVDIGNSKPSIAKVLHYNDEYDAPEINYENFASYNKRLNNPREYKLEANSYHGDGKLKIYEDDSGISRLSYDDLDGAESRNITQAELETINKGIREIQADYDKRLKTYFKRYGDKIYANGYWANR